MLSFVLFQVYGFFVLKMNVFILRLTKAKGNVNVGVHVNVFIPNETLITIVNEKNLHFYSYKLMFRRSFSLK